MSRINFREGKVLIDGIEKQLVVFEMANNHMGDVEYGLRIIREIAVRAKKFDSFAYAFKFQYRDLETFIHPDYQNRMDIKYVKRFSETRLGDEDFARLKKEAENFGFLTICTPFDEKSVEKVVAQGYDALKIASASFGDWPLLEKIVQYDIPMIASTGGAKVKTIDNVVSFLQHRNKKFALMHCVGEYPTPPEHLELNQIGFLATRYPSLPIGFSTHEEPDNRDAIALATAKGAKIFERHVAVPSDKYAMNAYSSTPDQIERWLDSAAAALRVIGVSGRRHESSEKELADIRQFQRGVFVSRDIKAGERLDGKNTFYAFPNQPGQLVANDMSKYTVILAEEDLPAKSPAAKVSKNETRDKVYAILLDLRKFITQSGLPVSNKLDFEISHHYGIDRFYEIGAALITCFNREYCKKLIVLLPNQMHPSHYHNIKEETFHILFGDFVFDLDGKETACKAGDIITIQRGVKHSFRSVNGGIFEEISTTHQASDSYYVDENITKNKSRKTQLTYWLE